MQLVTPSPPSKRIHSVVEAIRNERGVTHDEEDLPTPFVIEPQKTVPTASSELSQSPALQIFDVFEAATTHFAHDSAQTDFVEISPVAVVEAVAVFEVGTSTRDCLGTVVDNLLTNKDPLSADSEACGTVRPRAALLSSPIQSPPLSPPPHDILKTLDSEERVNPVTPRTNMFLSPPTLLDSAHSLSLSGLMPTSPQLSALMTASVPRIRKKYHPSQTIASPARPPQTHAHTTPVSPANPIDAMVGSVLQRHETVTGNVVYHSPSFLPRVSARGLYGSPVESVRPRFSMLIATTSRDEDLPMRLSPLPPLTETVTVQPRVSLLRRATSYVEEQELSVSTSPFPINRPFDEAS